MTPIDPTEIIRSPRLEVATRVADMDTSVLLRELKRALVVTAETIAYLGAVWRELERRGQDLSNYRTGIGEYLPLVAAGQLAPEAMVQFIGRLQLLRAVRLLPIDEQRRLADGGTVTVLREDRRTGALLPTEVPATTLTGEQIKQVFDGGRLRDVAEQANMIDSTRVAARRRRSLPAARRYRVNVDIDAKTVKIGRMILPLQEVIDALEAAGAIHGRRSGDQGDV